MAHDFTFVHRPKPYRVSLVIMVISTIFVVIGYATVHWVDCTTGGGHFGLWTQCGCKSTLETNITCRPHMSPLNPIDEILRVPQIMITLEVTALVVGSIIGVVVNVRKFVERRQRQRHWEVFAGVAGLLGFTAGTVFWVQKAKQDKSGSGNLPSSHLSWSFFFMFIPSVFCAFLSLVVSCGKDVIGAGDDQQNLTGQAAGTRRRRKRNGGERRPRAQNGNGNGNGNGVQQAI